ncbi:MAG: type II toxin-antitoxin system mRNA interferase toxin, RelE/StbE family [Lachnospiraceae bacterium]
MQPTNKFKKDLKLIQSRGYKIDLLTEIINQLATGESLPEKNKDHDLHGNKVDDKNGNTPQFILIKM